MLDTDHVHNARIDDDLYGQRFMAETVFSSLTRSLGCVLRARDWYRKFRSGALVCAVYNIRKAAKQQIPIFSALKRWRVFLLELFLVW